MNFEWACVTFGGAPHDAFTSRRTRAGQNMQKRLSRRPLARWSELDNLSELRAHHVESLDYSLKRPLYIPASSGQSLMGKRSVIKLLITNSRGKNSQEFRYADVLHRSRMYMCVRVNKIFIQSPRIVAPCALFLSNRRIKISCLIDNCVALIENFISKYILIIVLK